MIDTVFHNADVVTVDPAFPNARLVAIEANRIVAVSLGDDIHDFRGTHTRLVDCRGKTLVPGFVDAHSHLRALAESLVNMDLSPHGNIRTISDIQDRIGHLSAGRQAGHWIRGRGYDEFHLVEQRHPNRYDLDAATPAHPVKLTHRTGRAHVLNSLALEIVGITGESGDPPCGLIDRDPETGQPTGILFEMGSYLASRIPRLEDAEVIRGIRQADSLLLARGITSIQDTTAYNGPPQLMAAREWKESGILHPRVSMMVGEAGFEELIENGKDRFASFEPHVHVHGVKIVIDETTGSLQPAQPELDRLCRRVHGTGMQLAIHAVEEVAIASACTAIGRALQEVPRSGHRHRIEHCSVCPAELVQRLRDLGVWVVTQPAFLHYSGDRYLATVAPQKVPNLYPIGTLSRSGVCVAFGSDFPVAAPGPLVGIQSAVTRTTEGCRTLQESECIEPLQALRMHTLLAAAANFQETEKGSLTSGKLADMVLLSENPTKVPRERIKNITVDMTIIDGKIVWERS